MKDKLIVFTCLAMVFVGASIDTDTPTPPPIDETLAEWRH